MDNTGTGAVSLVVGGTTVSDAATRANVAASSIVLAGGGDIVSTEGVYGEIVGAYEDSGNPGSLALENASGTASFLFFGDEGLRKHTASPTAASDGTLFVGDKAYSAMSFRADDGPEEITISTQNKWTLVDVFESANGGVGPEDGNANVVGTRTAATSYFTFNAPGTYNVEWRASNGGASPGDVFFWAIGLTPASVPAITGATNATPIVVTSTGHSFKNGDGVTISGVGGNTAANGDHFIKNITANTFELIDFNGTDVAGSGAYTSGGTVDIIYGRETCSTRKVGSANDIGNMGGGCLLQVVAGDKASIYVANNDGTGNSVAKSYSFTAIRIDE